MPLDNPSALAATMHVGTYTGDATENRAIPHGLTGVPKFIFIMTDAPANASASCGFFVGARTDAIHSVGGNFWAVTTITTTNFYVGRTANYDETFNADTKVYYWVAFT